jgi:hypothetical protein
MDMPKEVNRCGSRSNCKMVGILTLNILKSVAFSYTCFMKVINLSGGPSCGKSTTAAGLFFAMKKLGYNVELVTEVAKDLVYERHTSMLADQISIFAQQNRRLARLLEYGIDYAITDSPIFLGLLYLKGRPEDPELKALTLKAFNQYDNSNYVLRRTTKFNPIGRLQDEETSIKLDAELITTLGDNDIKYKVVSASDDAIRQILEDHGLPNNAVLLP